MKVWQNESKAIFKVFLLCAIDIAHAVNYLLPGIPEFVVKMFFKNICFSPIALHLYYGNWD